MAYQIGDRVGDYQIVDVLGAGGMGRVYKVKNVISDRFEAMKVLLPNLESDPELADRFMREIKVQASLAHPNIAGLHTALRVNNQLLMLIEFVEGMTLEARLRQGPIPVIEGVGYIKDVLSALSYAHSLGVVHRDIKPANMMLTPGGVVKLMDFGIAKAAADRKLTQTGRTVGSLFYMSPEQIQGALDLDGRSDLYSVGVSLYEIVTNRRPFQGDSDFSIMSAHLNATPVPPLEFDRSLPPELNDAILMAIEKDPAKRFQTAEAFRAALTSVPFGFGTSVPPPRPQPASAARPGAISMSQLPTAPIAPSPLPGYTPAPITPGDGKRGLYMAIGAIVAIAVLAIAALQLPKLFKSSAAGDAASIADNRAATASPETSGASAAPPQNTPTPAPSPAAEASAGAPTQTASAQTPLSQPVGGRLQQPPLQRADGAADSSANSPLAASPQRAAEAQAQPYAAQPNQPSPPQQQAQAAPDRPSQPNPDESKEVALLKERLMLLDTRADSVRGSLNALKQQMGGLNLNAEFTTRESRLRAFLNQAEGAINARDTESAKRALDQAERVLEQLETKLGR